MTPIMMYDTCMIKQKESIREKLRNSIQFFNSLLFNCKIDEILSH